MTSPPTVHPRLEGGHLVVDLTRAQKVAGLIGDIRVPLHAITDVQLVPDTLAAVRGIRAPGLAVPGCTKIGTWRRRGRRELVVTRAGTPGLRIELEGARHDALVLAVPQPQRLAERIRDRARQEVALTFSSAAHTLAGTLLLPDGHAGGPVPAVLLLPGSGPLDRDSDHRRAPLGVTRLLAEALAGAGVASFRYDKRGTGASTGEFFRTGFDDNTVDARAALAALAGRPEIDADRIVVVGHSEGAFHATALGADDTSIAGLVLLAGAARPAEEVARYQARAVVPLLPAPVRGLLRLLSADLVGKQQKRFDVLRATTTDSTGRGPTKVNARWWREFLAADPRPQLAALTMPTLAVTGERDCQVDPADVDAIPRLVPGGRGVGYHDRLTRHTVDPELAVTPSPTIPLPTSRAKSSTCATELVSACSAVTHGPSPRSDCKVSISTIVTPPYSAPGIRVTATSVADPVPTTGHRAPPPNVEAACRAEVTLTP